MAFTKQLSLIVTIVCILPLGSQAQSFAAIGDFGTGDTNESKVAQLVKSWNPEFIITVGDNNYPKGEASTIDQNIGAFYSDFIYPYQGIYGSGDSVNNFFPSPGNHDYDTTDAITYYNYFTLPGNERYYDFVRGDVHFFSINSNEEEPDGISSNSIQANWLKNKLASSTSTWKVVYFHHAPYGSAGHGNDTTMQWPFKEWGADVVISGHNHIYERLEVDGFPYFIVGHGGRRLHTVSYTLLESQAIDDEFGALKITASPTALLFEAFDINYELVDSYELLKNAGGTAGVEIANLSSGLDDVEENENNGNIYVNSTDLELGYDPLLNQGFQTLGLRFTDVNVPPNAIITKSFIRFVSETPRTGACQVEIAAQLTGNALPFDIQSPFSVSQHPKTTNSVTWDVPDWPVTRVNQISPDLSNIVQELVDHPDWSIENAMAFVVKGNYGTREAESFEGKNSAAPQLYIEYEIPSYDHLFIAQVSSGNHDVEENESTGAVYPNSSDIELGFDPYNGQNFQTAGLRFTNIAIPQGSEITAAFLEFTVDAAKSNSCMLNVWGEQSGNALSFKLSNGFDLSSRSRTTEEIIWTPPNWTQVGAKQSSPDLSNIIEEIISQPNWQSGTSLNLFVKGFQGSREAESFESNPNDAAKLIIYYRPSIFSTIDLYANLDKGSDDVEENENNGTVYTNSSDLELGFDGYNQQHYQTVVLRYNNLGIPQGAIVQSAYLDFTVDETNGSISDIDISAELAAHSAPFDDMSFYNVSTRQRTQQSINWKASAWTSVGMKKTSPNLAALVQEIVDQNAWTAGNSMCFIIKGNTGTRTGESYESGSHLSAQLRVQYILGNSGKQASVMHQVPDAISTGILYPNPILSNQQLNLAFDQELSGTLDYRIYNALGQLVLQDVKHLNEESALVQLNIEGLSAGSYQLRLLNDEGFKNFSFIVQ